MTTYLVFLITLFAFMVIAKSKIYWYSRNVLLDNGESVNLEARNKIVSRRIKSVCFYAAILLIYFFAALRFDVGWDYMAYYDTIVDELSTNIMSNGEVLTILLIKFSRLINQPQLYFAINSAICILLVTITSKRYSKDPWLSIIFFVTFPLFYLNSFSVIRNFSAIAITFYGVRYIHEKKLLKYIIVVLVAAMFHKSALMAILFYFIKDIKIKTSKIIILLISLPICSKIVAFLIEKILPKYSGYLSKTTTQEGTKAIFVFLIITLACILFQKRLLRNKRVEIFFNNFLVGISIYLMFIENGTMGHRLSMYGTIYSVLLVPEIIHLFKNNKEKIILKIVFYLFCILMFLYTVSVGKETYIPYSTVFGN